MKHSFLFLSLAAIGLLTGCSKGSQQDFVAKQGDPIYIQCDTASVEPVVKTALELLSYDFATVLDAELHIAATLDSAAAKGHVIVMGNEGNGISDAVARCVNHRITIPNFNGMDQGADSLNVAVATAVVCSEFRRMSAMRQV